MKTAIELELLKALTIKERQEQEALRIAKLQEQHENVIANTVVFCETEVAERLEAMAVEGLDISIKFRIRQEKDELGNELFYLLKHDGIAYASGEKSLRIAEGPYDISTIERYLDSFLFSTEWVRHDYKTYGRGSFIGYDLVIKTTFFETPQ